jgi:phosphoribosylformylglycinamidine synthase PurS subunit
MRGKNMLEATVYITLKTGVLDPQGETMKHALHSLGYPEVRELRVGKYMRLKLEGHDRQQALDKLEQMCQRLLANPVIEDYRFEIDET